MGINVGKFGVPEFFNWYNVWLHVCLSNGDCYSLYVHLSEFGRL